MPTLEPTILPDHGEYAIHLTGRQGKSKARPPEISSMSAEDRLRNILYDGRVRGFPVFNTDTGVSCFSECTKESIAAQIEGGRYEPVGIGFSKQDLFVAGGAPCLYIRDDEFELTRGWPDPIRSRVVRYAPAGENSSRSEWTHEREWRVIGDFSFQWSLVKFLLVPNRLWLRSYASFMGATFGAEYERQLCEIPTFIASDGHRLEEC